MSLSSPTLANAPVVVSSSQAAQFIGQNVEVEGVVSAVSRTRDGITFISFGGVSPNQAFTAWIPAGSPLATGGWLLPLQGKKVKISGKIELYREKPAIRVVSKNQIREE